MTRPRILFVSPTVPFPTNSGTKIRVGHLMRGLCAVGDVDAVCYANPRDWDYFTQMPAGWPDWWDALHSIQLVRHPEWPSGDVRVYRKQIGHRIFSRKALLYANYPMEALRRRIGDLSVRADLIWAEHLYTAFALDYGGSKTIVDVNDLESIMMRRQADTERVRYTRWALQREADRLERAERGAARRFAHISVCSENDRSFLGGDAHRVSVVPNGVDDAFLDLRAVPRDPEKLLFVGTLNYPPNQDAIRFFCSEILPRVQAQQPNVSLSIVGANPTQSILDLHDGRSVFVHPNVPEMAPFVQGAALSIVPLRVGGGTRLKILESLALGTPVVSTTVGAEGLDLQDGEHLLLADSPDAFANAVVRVVRDSALRDRLAESGRRRVAQRYLWSSIRTRVANLAEEWLTASRRTAA